MLVWRAELFARATTASRDARLLHQPSGRLSLVGAHHGAVAPGMDPFARVQ